MAMKKSKFLAVSEAELRNILHALNLLHGKVTDNLAAINSFTDGGTDLRKYFVEKLQELNTMILEYNKTLIGPEVSQKDETVGKAS